MRRDRLTNRKADVMSKREYEMTEDDFQQLIYAIHAAPMIALHCGQPNSRQERANAAWGKLGKKMGFDPTTVNPSDRGYRFFSAIPVTVLNSDLISSASDLLDEQWKLVPVTPTEAQWCGLARDIVWWLSMGGPYTPESLFLHLKRLGQEIPQWMLDEPEMKRKHEVITKGTRAVLIYRAMIDAAPSKQG